MTRATRPLRTRSVTKVAAAAALSLAASLLIAPSLAQVAHADDPVDPVDPAVAHPPIWDKGPGGERYVAFGDSFTSGPGIAPQRASCARSEKNFPTLVAQQLDVRSFTDASCAAATTLDLTTPQNYSGLTNEPQLDALAPDTTLVTFGTLGGNDIGLVQLATKCSEATTCVPDEGTDPLAEKFADTRGRLVAGIQETKRRSPKADVVVIGYGTYVPKDGCPAAFLDLVDAAEFNYLQGQIDRLSDMLADVAREQGVPFVDQRKIPGALDHTVCAWPDQQWIRGINAFGDGYLMHPSTAGMRAIGDYVASEITKFRTPKPPVVTPPTQAQRLAALRAKAGTVKLSASCQGPRKASKRTVKLTVTGGKGAIAKVEFRAGKKKLAVDRKAPWSTKKKAKSVRKHLRKKSSKLSAVVTLRDGSLKVTKKVTVKRPDCVR